MEKTTEHKRVLGLYMGTDTAVGTILSSHGASVSVVDSFSVSKQNAEQENDSLIDLVIKKIAERTIQFSEASQAIDCALFKQHLLRSELTEYKQISQTIKFDAEEAVTSDIESLALTFTITDSNETGSDITVFTADKDVLQQSLAALQAGKIDPCAIEPDTVCLSRFLSHTLSSHIKPDTMFVVFSNHACYFIHYSESKHAPYTRAFLVSPNQNKTQVLFRQIPLTLAARKTEEPIQRLLIIGNDESIDMDTLAERTGLEIQTADLDQMMKLDNPPASTASSCQYAIAYGAALSEMIRSKPCDFREDFSPYLGKKKILQQMLLLLSISVTVMALAFGGYFQTRIIRKHAAIRKLEKKMQIDFSAAMFGKKHKGPEAIDKRMEREYNRLKRLKSGDFAEGDKSISAKLTFLLEAMNKTPDTVDLNIEEISVTKKSMSVRGDTNNRPATLAMFQSFEKHPKLNKLNETLKQQGNRDSFDVNLDLK